MMNSNVTMTLHVFLLPMNVMDGMTVSTEKMKITAVVLLMNSNVNMMVHVLLHHMNVMDLMNVN